MLYDKILLVRDTVMIIEIITYTLIIVCIGIITFVLTKALDSLFARTHKQLAFFKYLLRSLIYFLAVIMFLSTIPELRGIAYSLIASSGIIALAAGFASQQIFSNVISGVVISVTELFVIGDFIRVRGDHPVDGIVEDIALRHTTLRANNNNVIIIPNAILSSHIIEIIRKEA
jgi:small conductance mechanosensitive channel